MSRKYYAIVYPRNFGNEADIFAFESKEARNLFVEEEDLKNNNYNHRAYEIKQKNARHMLTENYLDPGTTNAIDGVNVYLSSKNSWVQHNRQEACKNGLEYRDLPEGAFKVPVCL